MSTQVTDHVTERKNGDKPAKQKFGLVLQGGGALGAYEVGALNTSTNAAWSARS